MANVTRAEIERVLDFLCELARKYNQDTRYYLGVDYVSTDPYDRDSHRGLLCYDGLGDERDSYIVPWALIENYDKYIAEFLEKQRRINEEHTEKAKALKQQQLEALPNELDYTLVPNTSNINNEGK
jgi:hypothetical protein